MVTAKSYRRIRKSLSGPWQIIKRWLYIRSGRIPWSLGYSAYRQYFLQQTIYNPELFQRFRTGAALPENYAYRLDERTIEIPWILAHLPAGNQVLLDAGGPLAYRFIVASPLLASKQLYACSITPDTGPAVAQNLHWVQSDLRALGMADAAVDLVCCISTLEHVGMDNTLHYVARRTFREDTPQGYQQAVLEMKRVLRPGGLFFLTVPFGKYQHLKWHQQFDAQMIDDVLKLFAGETLALDFYRFQSTGWQLATQSECNECEYFDYSDAPTHAPDFAAAARAVACLCLRKPK